MEELEEVANVARQSNMNSQHDQAQLAFADELDMGGQVHEGEEVNMDEHAMDKGRPKEREESQGDEEDIFKYLYEDMGRQLMDNNQPEQAPTPEHEKINMGGHAMNTGRPKKGKQSLDEDDDYMSDSDVPKHRGGAKRQLDDDEEDFGLGDFDDPDQDDDDSDQDDDGDPEIVSTVLAKNRVMWLTPIEN